MFDISQGNIQFFGANFLLVIIKDYKEGRVRELTVYESLDPPVELAIEKFNKAVAYVNEQSDCTL